MHIFWRNERMIKERIFYTDGACSGNPGAGGWAFVELVNSNGR